MQWGATLMITLQFRRMTEQLNVLDKEKDEHMRNCWERMRKIITYILAVSMLAFVMIPDVSYAADVEKKSAVTERG